MLWVEHDVELITQLDGRIVGLRYRHKIAEGSPAEKVSNPEIVEAYLGKGRDLVREVTRSGA